MSEYEELREDMGTIMSSMESYARAVAVFADVSGGEIDRLWADNAELRDELHALANRVETLTRAHLTEPAETAEAMVVSPSRWHHCDCGVLVRRSAADGLFYDAGGLHTCNVESVMGRRQS